MDTVHLEISGMSCGHCVARVQKTLAGTPGVEGASVMIGAADVRYDASRIAPGAIASAVADAGYATRVGGNSPHAGEGAA